jgi:hypothetical protein
MSEIVAAIRKLNLPKQVNLASRPPYLIALSSIAIAGIWSPAYAQTSARAHINDSRGGAFMDEVIDAPKDMSLQILEQAYRAVQQHRLIDADRWILYGQINGHAGELVRARDDRKYLESLINKTNAQSKPSLTSFADADLTVLHALLHLRLHGQEGENLLKQVSQKYPNYGAINQIKTILEAQNEIKSLKEQRVPITRYKHWPASKFPLKVAFPSDDKAAQSQGYVAGDNLLWRAAIDQWAAKTGGEAAFIETPDPRLADIVCGWEDNPEKMVHLDTVGSCNTSTDDKNAICKAEIKILTLRQPPSGIKFAADYRQSQLLYTMLHELGHALGLAHSSNPADLMYFQQTNVQKAKIMPQDLVAFSKIGNFGVPVTKCEMLLRQATKKIAAGQMDDATKILTEARDVEKANPSARLRLQILEDLQYVYRQTGDELKAKEIEEALNDSK